ncbi:hypothetical protein WG909_06740 [Peptostreptococcaceae bacterium AGR-M142]
MSDYYINDEMFFNLEKKDLLSSSRFKKNILKYMFFEIHFLISIILKEFFNLNYIIPSITFTILILTNFFLIKIFLEKEIKPFKLKAFRFYIKESSFYLENKFIKKEIYFDEVKSIKTSNKMVLIKGKNNLEILVPIHTLRQHNLKPKDLLNFTTNERNPKKVS